MFFGRLASVLQLPDYSRNASYLCATVCKFYKTHKMTRAEHHHQQPTSALFHQVNLGHLTPGPSSPCSKDICPIICSMCPPMRESCFVMLWFDMFSGKLRDTSFSVAPTTQTQVLFHYWHLMLQVKKGKACFGPLLQTSLQSFRAGLFILFCFNLILCTVIRFVFLVWIGAE